MKPIQKSLAALLLFGLFFNGISLCGSGFLQQIPEKTVIFKDPAAADPAKFFSGATVYRMWIHKAGSNEEISKMKGAFEKNKSVQSCDQGTTAGDYIELVLTLKKNTDKAWFVSTFKKAGINHIKINNEPIKEIGKF